MRRRARVRPNRLERPKQRFGLEHHPGSAAIRHVVYDAVPIRRKDTKIVHLYRQRAALDGAPENTSSKRLVDHRREDCDDVYAQFFNRDPYFPSPESRVLSPGELSRVSNSTRAG